MDEEVGEIPETLIARAETVAVHRRVELPVATVALDSEGLSKYAAGDCDVRALVSMGITWAGPLTFQGVPSL